MAKDRRLPPSPPPQPLRSAQLDARLPLGLGGAPASRLTLSPPHPALPPDPVTSRRDLSLHQAEFSAPRNRLPAPPSFGVARLVSGPGVLHVLPGPRCWTQRTFPGHIKKMGDAVASDSKRISQDLGFYRTPEAAALPKSQPGSLWTSCGTCHELRVCLWVTATRGAGNPGPEPKPRSGPSGLRSLPLDSTEAQGTRRMPRRTDSNRPALRARV